MTGKPSYRHAIVLLAALFATVGVVALPAQALAQAKTVLRISTPAVPDDWHAKMWTLFRDNLEKSAPGEFDVQITSTPPCSSRARSRRRWRAATSN
jgi:TRAP-type C4-dicarboxylate transport system substrate-binding protein